MINKLFEFILLLTGSLVNLILSPINMLIETIFPDFSSWVETFNQFLTNSLFDNVSWFLYMIPPITKGILFGVLTFMILFLNGYIVYMTIRAFVNIYHKLKP